MRTRRALSLVALSLLGGAVGLGLVRANTSAELGKDLERAVKAQDVKQIQPVLQKLIDGGGPDHLKPILKLVQVTTRGGSQTVYWQLVSGAAGFRDAAALSHLGEFIVTWGKKGAPFAKDLLFALESSSSASATEALRRVLAEKNCYDLQLMAADQLGHIHTSGSVDVLIDALKAEGEKGDPDLRRRIIASLQTITKEDLGSVAASWVDWWQANKSKGLKQVQDEARPSGGDKFATSTMNRDRKKRFESLTKDPNRILVISSHIPKDHPKKAARENLDLDHMEQVLEAMKIPHKVVTKIEFEKDADKYLNAAWTILVNCNYIQTMCVCKDCGRINAEKVAKGGSIGPKKNRLFSCPSECPTHDQVSFRLKKETIMKMKAWVEKGGYLFTEDWGLIEVVEVAWPDLITSDSKTSAAAAGGKEYSLLKAADVVIMPGKGMTSRPILRGVFMKPRPPVKEGGDEKKEGGLGRTSVRGDDDPTQPPSHKWKIDDESPSIKVKNDRLVEVLMRSEDLLKLAAPSDAVAVTFRAGNARPWTEAKAKEPKERKTTGGGSDSGRTSSRSRGKGHWSELQPGGRVLHVLSHFGKQQSSDKDTFVLQNLILNFIMESNRQHGGE